MHVISILQCVHVMFQSCTSELLLLAMHYVIKKNNNKKSASEIHTPAYARSTDICWKYSLFPSGSFLLLTKEILTKDLSNTKQCVPAFTLNIDAGPSSSIRAQWSTKHLPLTFISGEKQVYKFRYLFFETIASATMYWRHQDNLLYVDVLLYRLFCKGRLDSFRVID